MLNINEDVLYLQTDGGGRLLFHTFDKEYRALQGVEDWANYLHHRGFHRIDRGTIVNLRKIEVFDQELRVLILNTFDGAVSLPIAESMIKVLHEELRIMGWKR
ncbi:hypothetical protein PAECIP111893_04204 [Paenibacillus plantiphilus]|uniref:HTH LytTR-type domain-containing protein n=1 Tax=Paenibacillus plantiphilus TaxID=2905650 RepID=A0ABN8GVI0_9BACL|nr:LytTR family DNA-binding domain-containing protein [Paenibacillus plantiphilus]CAH1216915.1 hypothetical protein PAECIP111893_04204 [Paenibacillus plantiphilus]